MSTSGLDITVRFASGAHNTNTVRGQRASSTMSAKAAAERLGEKLFGKCLVDVELIKREDSTRVECWRIHYRCVTRHAPQRSA